MNARCPIQHEREHPMSNPTDLVLTVTPGAADQINDIGNQAAAVAHIWRNLDPEAASRCVLSATRQITQLFSKFFGDTAQIARDGDLSLYVSTGSGFVFGLVFHGDHNVWVDGKCHKISLPQDGDIDLSSGAKVLGRYCMAPNTGSTGGGHCAQPYWFDYQREREGADPSVPTCEGHDAVPAKLPIPGTWDFHS